MLKTLDPRSPEDNKRLPLVLSPKYVFKDLSAHRVSSLIPFHEPVIDRFVGRVNERPSMLIIILQDHLDDSPLAIMQHSGLEVLVVEIHSAVIVENINSPIIVLEDGVQHGLRLNVVRFVR